MKNTLRLLLTVLLAFLVVPLSARNLEDPDKSPDNDRLFPADRYTLSLRANLLRWAALTPDLGIDWNATNPGSGGITLKDTYDQATRTYYAYTAEGLDEWATIARADLTVNCILLADIDYSGKEWTPVGSSIANGYAGTFDGNGHAISNIKISGNAQKAAASPLRAAARTMSCE